MGKVGKIGSQRAYAQRRGLTHRAVQQCAATGRITSLADEQINFDEEDLALTENGGVRRKSRACTLVEAQRQLVLCKARLARLD